MTVNQVPFADVFDGSVSFAPKAIINMPLEDIVHRRKLTVEAGEDGLDAFMAVPMVLETGDGSQLRFALWRHQGNPENTFAIHFGLAKLDVPGLLDAVLLQLDIPADAVIWRAPEATPTLIEKNTTLTAMINSMTIEMTENAKWAVVSKPARVVEEVTLHREAIERVETVHGIVRKEEVDTEQAHDNAPSSSTLLPKS